MSMSIEDAARGTEHQFKLVAAENGEQIIEMWGVHPISENIEVLAEIKLKEGVSSNYIEYIHQGIMRKEEVIKFVRNEIILGELGNYIRSVANKDSSTVKY